METHIYLHKNGGFPQIFKDAYPKFIDEEVVIISVKGGEELAYYENKDVFRIDVLMETE